MNPSESQGRVPLHYYSSIRGSSNLPARGTCMIALRQRRSRFDVALTSCRNAPRMSMFRPPSGSVQASTTDHSRPYQTNMNPISRVAIASGPGSFNSGEGSPNKAKNASRCWLAAHVMAMKEWHIFGWRVFQGKMPCRLTPFFGRVVDS